MSKAPAQATDEPALDPSGRGSYDPQTGLWEWYEQEGVPLGAVVGEGVKRIRTARGLTQHEVCQAWRRYGLNWARSKLAALETGARPHIDAGELVLMAGGLGVQIPALFAGDDAELVALDQAGRARVRLAQLRELFSGRARSLEFDLAVEQAGPADVDLAKRLGIEPRDVAMTAAAMFGGRNLTQERDLRVRRLGELTPAQRQAHRGHITRELSKEIENVLAAQRETRSKRRRKGSSR